MPREFTYAEAGVDRELRKASKRALKRLKGTHGFSRFGAVVHLPYGNIFPLGDRYLDLQIEGVGTKVLLAQLAEKHDTIGIDGVAMAANDVLRSGARPLAIVDNIHAQASDPRLVEEWMKGIDEGASKAECLVPSGEIGDVAEVIRGVVEGEGFDMVFACLGELGEENIIYGDHLKLGDVVVGLRSSGVHSNGISLARKVLFKAWGGRYEPYYRPEELDREVVLEALEPTRIYVKPLLKVYESYEVLGAVHITGDAYLKFGNLMTFSRDIGFEFDNFKPQPIFELIRKTASEARGEIGDEEMLKTFNMGWGFAVIVDRRIVDEVVGCLEREGVEAEPIGRVTDTGKIVAKYRGKRIVLK